jgi:hypothetical protein
MAIAQYADDLRANGVSVPIQADKRRLIFRIDNPLRVTRYPHAVQGQCRNRSFAGYEHYSWELCILGITITRGFTYLSAIEGKGCYHSW